VEMVRQILECAASDFMLDAAAWVADMLLLNRAARSWLTPIVYRVFIVRLPDELDSTHSKSFTCFLSMLIHPDGFPHRAHIRHLVFRVRHERTEFSSPLEDLFDDAPDAAEWPVESVTADFASLSDLADVRLYSSLRPLALLACPPTTLIGKDEIERYTTDGTARPIHAGCLKMWGDEVAANASWRVKTVCVAIDARFPPIPQAWKMVFSGIRRAEDTNVYARLRLPSAEGLGPLAQGLFHVLKKADATTSVVLSFEFVDGLSGEDAVPLLRSHLQRLEEENGPNVCDRVFSVDASADETVFGAIGDEPMRLYRRLQDHRQLVDYSPRPLV